MVRAVCLNARMEDGKVGSRLAKMKTENLFGKMSKPICDWLCKNTGGVQRALSVPLKARKKR